MQEQKEQSDETIGVKCTIQIRPMTRNNRKYEYRFAKLEDEKFSELNKNDYVYVLTASEYSQLIDQQNNVTEIDAANDDDEINSLKQKVDELKQQLKETNENTIAIDKHTAMIQSKQDKIDNLTTLNNEYISQNQHYNELNELKDELTNTKIELESIKASIETKLTTQKNELEKEHADKINELKDKLRDAEKEHTNEKAQLLVAYNNDLNYNKMKYNELANKYNSLLSDARSLTRTNTLFNGKHKQIIKDKEPIEIELIPSEQLPSDEAILYVPKNEKQE